MQNKLKSVFDVVQLVNVLDSKDSANLAVLKRPELGITFTKLNCWKLTQFEKCVFLDADVLILRNCDELFERDEFSAAPDVGWPDCFNSGVFVFTPSSDTYGKLIEFAATTGSFDGGDQGLLNSYFSDWSTSDSTKRLPFLYNTASTATYSYLPAFKKFNQEIKIIHFIGETKPWLQHFNSLSKQVNTPQGYNHLQGFLQLWWDLFCEKVHPELNEEMSGIAGALANITLGTERSVEQIALEDNFRRFNWEAGQIDYLGEDSFSNIWKRIQTTIDTPAKVNAPTKANAPKSVATETPVVATVSSSAVKNSPVFEPKKTEGSSKTATREFFDAVEEKVDPEEAMAIRNNLASMVNQPPRVQVNADGSKSTIVIIRIDNGYRETTTTKKSDGSTRVATREFYDPVEEEVTESGNGTTSRRVVQSNQLQSSISNNMKSIKMFG
ncbi:unnamed protein product [Diamesa tonsa]